MMNHQQIMGDKQIGNTQFFLKLLKHIDDLRLNGNIQCRNRLITDDKLRVHSKGACNPDSLPLSAGKLMGITRCVFSI